VLGKEECRQRSPAMTLILFRLGHGYDASRAEREKII